MSARSAAKKWTCSELLARTTSLSIQIFEIQDSTRALWDELGGGPDLTLLHDLQKEGVPLRLRVEGAALTQDLRTVLSRHHRELSDLAAKMGQLVDRAEGRHQSWGVV